jgi:hypothetical protein
MDDRVRTDHLSSARWGQGFSIGSPSVEASVIFCSEVLAPMLGRELVERQRASLLVFVLAHDQFDSPYTLTVDTLRFLKVRTVEASVPSVASAHDTPAYAFDRFGRVTMSLGVDGSSKYGIAHLEVLSTEDRR